VDFFQKNRVPIMLACAALFVFGLISLFSTRLDLIPDIEFPELTVVTFYPNAPPEEVKTIVTLPVEQAVLSLKAVKNIDSISREGTSIVRVRYGWGTDVDTAHIELREKLDLLKSSLHGEVTRPVIVHRGAHNDPVACIAVSSNSIDPRLLYLTCREDVSGFLGRVNGVGRIELKGGEEPEVLVRLDPERLLKYRLTLQEIESAVQRSNKSCPVGYLKEDEFEYLIRVNGEIEDYRELGEIVIRREGLRLVFLRDIADIIYGTVRKEHGVFINNAEALVFFIYKRPAANIIEVADEIDRAVDVLNERYAGKIYFNKVFDESGYIRSSLFEMALAIAAGTLFTALTVFLLMGSFRFGFIVVFSIPFSIISAFVFMKPVGISINLLTLGGFSLALGMIVDNSVIVINGVMDGNGMYVGAVFTERLKKVMPAVFSATVTTIIVFLPVFFLSGILRIVFVQMTAVIAVSLLLSLFFAVTLVPVLILGLKTEKAGGFTSPLTFIKRVYSSLLGLALGRKGLFLLALGITFAAGVLSYRSLDKCLIQSVPQDYFSLSIFGDRQAGYRYTQNLTKRVTECVIRERGVHSVVAMVGCDRTDVLGNLDGRYGPNTAVLTIRSEKGDIYEVMETVRDRVSIFDGVRFVFHIPDNPVQRLITRSDFDNVVKVWTGGEEAGKVHDLASKLHENTDYGDFLISPGETRIERSAELKRDNLALSSIDGTAVGRFIGTVLDGAALSTWRMEEHAIPVRLGFSDIHSGSTESLLGFSMINDRGDAVPLSDLVSIEQASSPAVILRENQREYSKIEFNTLRRTRGVFTRGRRDEKALIQSYLETENISWEYVDRNGPLRESFQGILLSLFLALFLEFIVLAGLFRSLLKGGLVILIVLIAFPGLFFILRVAGSTLNINSYMSMIVLVGLAVNNAIMLFLDYENSGVRSKNGLILISSERLRPILTTTVSTVCALIPVLFTGNEIQHNLAVTLICGLLYSTAVTLVFLPLFYEAVFLRAERDSGKRDA